MPLSLPEVEALLKQCTTIAPGSPHPTAHVELHEERGYARLHGLQATLICALHAPTLAADLDRCPERRVALLMPLFTRMFAQAGAA